MAQAPPPTPTRNAATWWRRTSAFVASSLRSTRTKRWLWRGALVSVLLLVLTVGSALALVDSLDRPWFKQRVCELLRNQTGLEIDYGKVELAGSTLMLEGLVVRSPQAVQKHAPDLLTIRRVRASFPPIELAGGAPWLRNVDLSDVALTVVLDEHGKSSFDAIPSPPSSGAPQPATPLSSQAATLLDGFPVRELHASGLALTLVRIEHDVVLDRSALSGLELSLTASTSQLHVRAAPSANVLLTRAQPGLPEQTAQLKLRLQADTSPTQAHVTLDTRVVSQTLRSDLTVDVLAQLEASASFEPAQQRTQVAVKRLALVDDAVHTTLSLNLPDHAAPHIVHAVGDLDAVRLLALLRAWSLPLRLSAGRLHYQIDQLTLDRPATTALVSVEGELRDVELEESGSLLGIGHVRLSLHGKPEAGALRVTGDATLDGLRLHEASERVGADDVTCEWSGLQQQSGVIDGQATLRFGGLTTSTLVAHHGKVALSAHELRVALAAPEQARGQLELTADISTVEASDVLAATNHVRVDLPLTGGAPFALKAALTSERVELRQSNGKVVALPLSAQLHLTELVPQQTEPLRSLARVRGSMQAGALQLSFDADKAQEHLDYTLSASAAQLSELTVLLAADDARRVPLDKLSLQLRSQGRVEQLLSSTPRLRQHSELRVDNPALDDVAARSVVMSLNSTGTTMRHQLQAEMRVDGLHRGEHPLGHEHLTLTASVDRNQPSLHVKVSSLALPRTLLDASLRFQRKKRLLDYKLSGHLSELSALSTLLSQKKFFSGVDVTDLDLKFQAEGSLSGVVSSIDERGIRLSPNLLRTMAGNASAEVTARALRWAENDVAVSIPDAHWRMSLRSEGERRLLESEVVAEQLDAALGDKHLGVRGFRDLTNVTVVGGLEGTLEHTQKVWARAVQQDFVPSYPVGDVHAVIRFKRQGDGLIKLTELRVDNPLGGSKLALSGGLELSLDERRLSLRSTVEQDLSLLSNRHDQLEGKGKVALEVALSSPDLRLFHAVAKLQLAAATLKLPGEKIALESMDGELPVLSDFIVGPDGVEILRGAQINPYAAQRFADQHPLLGHRSFLSIANVSTPWVKLAPFAANLEVARNIVSLSQLEMGVRGGTITGNGNFEYNGADSKIDANVRASGVRSSHGEPFDGNAALSIGLRERTVEGRADILRIGRRHLQDLLDLQDPLRADASLNQIRTALHFGYPDRVKLSFQHGFASAGVEFAGLARLIRLKDVRGIPLGPLMERVMSSVQPTAVEP